MQVDSQKTGDHAWSGMGNTLVLRKWAQQLRTLREKDADDTLWEITGRFVMLVHPNKSHQIKLLKLAAVQAGFEFKEADGDRLVEMVLADEEYEENGPALVYIPQGQWSDASELIGQELKDRNRFHANLGAYLKRFATSKKLVFATAGESYGDINSALRSAGAIDRRFLIPRPSFSEIGDSFIDLVGRSRCDESLLDSPDKVGMLLTIEFDDERRQGLVALGMRRMGYEESRKLCFDDLVHFAVRGSGDADLVPEQDENMLKRVAVHESGHALMSYLDSGGMNVPDYITVLPGHQFRGASADSYLYMGEIHGKHSYEDSRHKIRVLLAGRAAESIVLGRTKVGTFGPDGHLKLLHLWPVKLLQAGRVNYA